MYREILIFYSPTHDNSYSQKNTVTEPILISISQDVSIISVTEITGMRHMPHATPEKILK